MSESGINVPVRHPCWHCSTEKQALQPSCLSSCSSEAGFQTEIEWRGSNARNMWHEATLPWLIEVRTEPQARRDAIPTQIYRISPQILNCVIKRKKIVNASQPPPIGMPLEIIKVLSTTNSKTRFQTPKFIPLTF